LFRHFLPHFFDKGFAFAQGFFDLVKLFFFLLSRRENIFNIIQDRRTHHFPHNIPGFLSGLPCSLNNIFRGRPSRFLIINRGYVNGCLIQQRILFFSYLPLLCIFFFAFLYICVFRPFFLLFWFRLFSGPPSSNRFWFFAFPFAIGF